MSGQGTQLMRMEAHIRSLYGLGRASSGFALQPKQKGYCFSGGSVGGLSTTGRTEEPRSRWRSFVLELLHRVGAVPRDGEQQTREGGRNGRTTEGKKLSLNSATAKLGRELSWVQGGDGGQTLADPAQVGSSRPGSSKGSQARQSNPCFQASFDVLLFISTHLTLLVAETASSLVRPSGGDPIHADAGSVCFYPSHLNIETAQGLGYSRVQPTVGKQHPRTPKHANRRSARDELKPSAEHTIQTSKSCLRLGSQRLAMHILLQPNVSDIRGLMMVRL